MNIAVIGCGVVGGATGLGFIEKGHNVIFCDVDSEVLGRFSHQGYQVCSPDSLFEMSHVDAFFLSLPTPTVDGRIKLDWLMSAVKNLGKGALRQCRDYCIVVVRSTVPPGTTQESIIPLLEQESGKVAGKDFGVCMNPEFLRENRNRKDFANPWTVVIGQLDERSGDVLQEIYGPQECPVHRVSLEVAEMEKYAHNLFNAATISFFNEMRRICEMLGIDADSVFPLVVESAEAQWNPAYGIKDLGPFGGSCLPKDTTAFASWVQDRLGEKMPLLNAVIEVNEALKEAKTELVS